MLGKGTHRRKGRLQGGRSRQGRRQGGLRINGATGHSGVFRSHQVRLRGGHQLTQGLGAGLRPEKWRGQPAHGHRTGGADLVLHRLASTHEHGVATGVHAGKGGPAIARHEQVTDTPTPARGRTLRVGALPDRLLVVVGKELGRQGHIGRGVLRFRGGLDQGADIQQHAQRASIEHRLEGRQVWSHGDLTTIGQAVAQGQRSGRQGVSLMGDGGPNAKVFSVAGAVIGWQHVPVVIAPVQENAHQGLVVGGGAGLRRGLGHGRQVQRPRGCRTGQAQLTQSLHEGTSIATVEMAHRWALRLEPGIRGPPTPGTPRHRPG